MFIIFNFLMSSANIFVFIFPFLIYFYLNHKNISIKSFKEFFKYNFISVFLFYLFNMSFKILCLFPLNYRKYIFVVYLILILIQLIFLILTEKGQYILLLFPTILVNFWFFMAFYNNKCPLYTGIIEGKAYVIFFVGIIGMFIISIISWTIITKFFIYLYKNRKKYNMIVSFIKKTFYNAKKLLTKNFGN